MAHNIQHHARTQYCSTKLPQYTNTYPFQRHRVVTRSSTNARNNIIPSLSRRRILRDYLLPTPKRMRSKSWRNLYVVRLCRPCRIISELRDETPCHRVDALDSSSSPQESIESGTWATSLEQKRKCNGEKRHGTLTRCSRMFTHPGTHIAEGRDCHPRAVQPTVCFSTCNSDGQFKGAELLDR